MKELETIYDEVCKSIEYYTSHHFWEWECTECPDRSRLDTYYRSARDELQRDYGDKIDLLNLFHSDFDFDKYFTNRWNNLRSLWFHTYGGYYAKKRESTV